MNLPDHVKATTRRHVTAAPAYVMASAYLTEAVGHASALGAVGVAAYGLEAAMRLRERRQRAGDDETREQ